MELGFFSLFQIPKYGIFENINSLRELAQMPQWTESKPLRVATGFTYVCNALCFLSIVYFYFLLVLMVLFSLVVLCCSMQLGPKFMKENGLKYVSFSTADGALEAAPAVSYTSSE